jgi:D-alanine-D-alanine ligase
MVSASIARIAVAFGGPSPEHDVSILTGLLAAHELARAGRDVTCLYWSKTGSWHEVDPSSEATDFVEGVPRGARSLRLACGEGGGFHYDAGRLGRTRPIELDVVINCCHGGPGEDGSLQAALDLAGIAYTGPDAAGAALGMDKLAFAGVAEAAGLPVLPRRPLLAGVDDVGFAGPYIVKPRFGGSSIGIQVVTDLATAVAQLGVGTHFRRGAVVEPYRETLYDLNLAVRTFPVVSLSAIERPLRTSAHAEILGYHDKYVGGQGMISAPRELPALLGEAVSDRVRDCALEVASVCAVRGVARIDFLSDGDEVFVNEINTVPGSLSKYLWVAPAVAFLEILDDMVEEAQARPAARFSSAGADGSVLRGAGAIASKLA